MHTYSWPRVLFVQTHNYVENRTAWSVRALLQCPVEYVIYLHDPIWPCLSCLNNHKLITDIKIMFLSSSQFATLC
jgi:hypothetical protein